MSNLNEDKTAASWPWSLILGIVAALAAGYFIGYLFSALLIAVLVVCYKKRYPGMPEGGYCLARTRKCLSQLGWAVLFLTIGVALGVFHWSLSQAGQSAGDNKEYAEYILSLIGAIGFAAAGIFTGFCALRDALFPAKSALAKSIRAQLPNPDNAPEVGELFAMVDEDIKENGQWFDHIAVGREWVLGDRAGYMPNMRVIFGRDEVVHSRRNGSVQSTRIVELYVMDNKRQVQCFALYNPNELPMLISCITLRAPGVLVKPFAEYPAWRKKSDEEWEKILKEYTSRLSSARGDLLCCLEKILKEYASRRAQELQGGPSGGGESQTMILSRSDGFSRQEQEKKRVLPPPHLSLLTPLGVFQSHNSFTLEDVQVAADGLIDGTYQEVELTLPGGYLLMRVQVQDRQKERCLVCATRADADKLRFFKRQATCRQAAFWLMEFANGVFCIEGREWKEYTRQVEKKSTNSRRKE